MVKGRALIVVVLLAACRSVAVPTAPVADCGADRTCRRRPRLALDARELRVGYGTVRAVEVRTSGLWQLDGRTWERRPLEPRRIVVAPDRALPLADLIGAPLGRGNYFLTYAANGYHECQAIAIDAMCNDQMIEVAPGQVALCVADHGARSIPDPARLVPGCEHSGYVEWDEPASGDGTALVRLEDGRVAVEIDYRDGRPHGKRRTHLTPSGDAQHIEADVVDGKDHGTIRSFDAAGRVRTELSYAGGRRHGPHRTFGPAGELLEEWTWRDGLLYQVRIQDAAGREVAHEQYPDGRAQGTFCRPDHHCSQY